MTCFLSLGVNIDHIATLRNVRIARYPEPLLAAMLAEQGGADSITVHLREDRRHIRDEDVELLQQKLHTRLNLEIAATDEMLTIAQTIKPARVCLVPEKRQEITTERGLDVCGQQQKIADAIAGLHAAGISVSLFIDAHVPQIEMAKQLGADAIEIHTGYYASTQGIAKRNSVEQIIGAARLAHDLGLSVHAGHGLDYDNVGPIAAISALSELNIGHAIVARALMTGIQEAVRFMKDKMYQARHAG